MGEKAVFLDRDNTLIEDPGYINDPKQVELLPAVADALIQLRKSGYKLVVVSNQSGVARGIVTEEVLGKIHQKMLDLLRSENAYIDRIYYCPYHPDGVIKKYTKESDMRKPSAGMLLLAAKEMDIDLEKSWVVGDSYRDVIAGKIAGCRTILINSPVHPPERKSSDPDPDRKVVNIKEAANVIRMCDQRDRKVADEKSDIKKNKPEDVEHPQTSKSPMKQTTKPKTPKPSSVKATSKPQISDSGEPSTAATAKPKSQHGDIESLLHEIVHKLNRIDRTDMFEDTSVWNILGVSAQILVFACLLFSIWFMLDQTRTIGSVNTAISYAIVLQLMVIAICLAKRRK